MITTCQCEHCSGAVEFELDQWQEGAIGDCPHCNQETRLRRIDVNVPPMPPVKNVVYEDRIKATAWKPQRTDWKPINSSAEAIFYVFGFFGVLAAALCALGGNTTGAVGIGFGAMILWGFASVLAHLRNIAEKP